MTNKKFEFEHGRLGNDAQFQLVGWLLEFAYHHHRPQVLVAVAESFPEIHELFEHNDKHLLLLHSFLTTFKKCGPLPELTSPSFLYSLNKALMDFIKVHPAIFSSVPRTDLTKLFSALRWLLVASTVHQKQFTTSDIKNLLDQICPDLAETSTEWKVLQTVLSIDEMAEDGDHVRLALKLSFSRIRSYWEKKIESTEKLATERGKDNSPKLTKVFETVKEILWKIGTYVSNILPKTALEQIKDGMEPTNRDLKYLNQTLKSRTLDDQHLLHMLQEVSITRKNFI